MVYNNRQERKRPEWRVIERRVRGDAGIIVSELPLPVPRYSFKVGTAKVNPETKELFVTSYLTLFNTQDACDLLDEMTDKYVRQREDIKDELEETRRRWEMEED